MERKEVDGALQIYTSDIRQSFIADEFKTLEKALYSESDVKLGEELDVENFINPGLIAANSNYYLPGDSPNVEAFFTIPQSPKSIYSLYLDDDGIRFIEHYEKIFTSVLSLGFDDSHYFVKTFLKLANENEIILYLIASFGGLLLECINKDDTDNQIIHRDSKLKYMKKANDILNSKYKNNLGSNKDDFFILMCYYLLKLSYEVCSGDTNNWYVHFLQCKEIFDNFGGLRKAMEVFNYSNDIKWLISDFQFHDVVNSTGVNNGTLYPTELYAELSQSYDGFGIDPFQSVAGPIFLILGKINNCYVELNNQFEMINSLENGEEKRKLRNEHFKLVNLKAQQLMEELDNSTPNHEHVELLLSDVSELESQMTFFELLNLTCKIHLNSTIKQLPPKSYEQQHLLIQCFDRMEIVLDSKMMTALPIVFAICGSIAVTEDDRDFIRRCTEKSLLDYKLGNYRNIVELIHEAWKRNPNGDLVLNWHTIASEKGWHLSIG